MLDMEDPKYKFQEPFQRKIAALCLKDPVFLQDYEDVVDPRFFEFDYISSIVRIAKGHVEKHKELPSKSTLVESVKEHCDTYRVSERDSQEILDKLETLYTIDVADPSSVKDKVIRFGKRQALKSAVMEIADLIDTDSEYERSVELINNANQVGQNTRDLGIQAFGSFSDLPRLLAEEGSYDPAKKISTLLPSLDKAIYGGPGRKEVWVIMGLSGFGKSQWLVNMGAAAINQGYNVVHVTVGDLDQLDVMTRYGARLTHLPIEEVAGNSEAYKRCAQKIDKFTGRYLRIKYYSAGSVTTGMIRAYLSRLMARDGIKPDLILLDYPDKFRRMHENDYTNMGIIYQDICGMAGDFNCVIWAASQVKRWSAWNDEKEYLTQDKVADSFHKAQDVDGIVTFNQTMDENNRGRARAWVDKVRRGKKQFLIHLECDFAKSYLREMTPQELAREEEYLAVDREREAEIRKQTRNKAKRNNALEAKRLEEER